MAERLGAVRVQAEALTTLGFLPGQPHEEAVSALTRAVELAESEGLLYQATRAHQNLGGRLDDAQAAREHFLRAAELGGKGARLLGRVLFRTQCSFSLAPAGRPRGSGRGAPIAASVAGRSR